MHSLCCAVVLRWWQNLFDHGEAQEASNAKPFLTQPRFDVLEEGSVYCGAWLETQPMGGAMWASRSVRLALNNQLAFLRAQRADGRYPHRVDGCGAYETITATDWMSHASCAVVHFNWIHGVCCVVTHTLCSMVAAASWHHPAPTTCTAAALPHLQPADATTDWSGTGLQGLYMASPAVDVAWYMRLAHDNQATAYLTELKQSLELYDSYLWTNRNDSTCFALHNGTQVAHNCPSNPSAGAANRRHLLWSVGIADSGEDGSVKFCRKQTSTNNLQTLAWTDCDGPFLTMDMAGYSFDLRRSIARINLLQGNTSAHQQWTAAAASVAAAAKVSLWRPELSAMFSRNADDSWVTSLQHTNLRMMWLGLFDQEMADAFVRDNLMNTSRFWTKMPLPSISVSDPHFTWNAADSNNWSGGPEGLTLQRAIRALEAYGHHAESVLVGLQLTQALLNTPGCVTNSSRCAFPQQIDPFTAKPQGGDGYGPMILSLLEYTARRVGVVAEPNNQTGSLLFSAVYYSNAPTNSTFTQKIAEKDFQQISTCEKGEVTATGSLGDKILFTTSCRATSSSDHALVGIRMYTTQSGEVTAAVGIANATQACTLKVGSASVTLQIKPNERWKVVKSANSLVTTRVRSTPFTPPHKTDDGMSSWDVKAGYKCANSNQNKIDFLPRSNLTSCKDACDADPDCVELELRLTNPFWCALYNSSAGGVAEADGYTCACKGRCISPAFIRFDDAYTSRNGDSNDVVLLKDTPHKISGIAFGTEAVDICESPFPVCLHRTFADCSLTVAAAAAAAATAGASW
jgi:hypothetical protein